MCFICLKNIHVGAFFRKKCSCARKSKVLQIRKILGLVNCQFISIIALASILQWLKTMNLKH